MTYKLSTKATLLSKQVGLNPNLVLKIKGIDEIFGMVEVSKLIRIGDPDLFIDGSWNIGGVKADENSRPWISLDNTSKSITSQLLQDKGGSSSVSSVNIEIIDKNNELSKIFKPGFNVEDILAAEAHVYLGFREGAFPEDYIEIFSGICESADLGATSARIGIAHPEQLKRAEIFTQAVSSLEMTTQIDPGDTDPEAPLGIDENAATITLVSVIGLLLPSPEVSCYVVMGDEIIQYSGISGNDLIGCVRGSLNTIALIHENEEESTSFYTLEGKPIETALKIMLSDDLSLNIEEDLPISSVNFVLPTQIIDGAYFFLESNIQTRLGLVVGDLFTVSGTASDFSSEPITGFGTNSIGSYILTAATGRPNEQDSPGVATFKSKYNVLNPGCGLGLKSNQVDISGHESINALFGSAFPDYLLYIKDTVEGKKFIEKELYFPSGLYNLPRNGRAGVGYTSPPLAIQEIKILDASNVEKPENLRIKRSINSNFYNSVIFKYELDSLTDKYLANRVTLSTDSTSRIKAGNKSLIIPSSGLRKNEVTTNLIDRLTKNLLNRYQFAADLLPNVMVLPNIGYNVEVGDVLIVDFASLQIADNSTGNRAGRSRMMEVVNKSLDVTTTKIKLTLLDTTFGVDARFTVISPSSIIEAGSTTTVLRLKESFSTDPGVLETEKWNDWQKEPLIVRSQDWSVQEVVDFKIHPSIVNALLLKTPLSFTPSENYYVDVAPYREASSTLKVVFGYINPSSLVVSGSSGTEFNVAIGEEVKFFVGGFIRVHSHDYSSDSGQKEILNIVGQTITCADLGFTPVNDYEIELIGFISDNGLPYAYL